MVLRYQEVSSTQANWIEIMETTSGLNRSKRRCPMLELLLRFSTSRNLLRLDGLRRVDTWSLTSRWTLPGRLVGSYTVIGLLTLSDQRMLGSFHATVSAPPSHTLPPMTHFCGYPKCVPSSALIPETLCSLWGGIWAGERWESGIDTKSSLRRQVCWP